jgi:hypothetical protein
MDLWTWMKRRRPSENSVKLFVQIRGLSGRNVVFWNPIPIPNARKQTQVYVTFDKRNNPQLEPKTHLEFIKNYIRRYCI